ncbi:dihydrofolate reductase family protein [Tengunoibacter tsumagoiensis]|uniref:dihydrofolate reductase family protein n=1 Tax=Tengunoibacter tsumagoiensis TaxID=2014871 RepID=UPI001FE81866|nr:dihydrofolate reductase family protein [Tengunoibacter tsumagoiensis]
MLNDDILFENEPSGRTGTRAPHVWLNHNGKQISILDLYGNRFVLLAGPSGQCWLVASTTLVSPLPWMNSTLLKGDAAETVARLKQEAGTDLVIMGSGALVQSLMQANLVDTYVLLIHPLVLGSGRHLFPEGEATTTFQLVGTRTTSAGVVIATYQLAQENR